MRQSSRLALQAAHEGGTGHAGVTRNKDPLVRKVEPDRVGFHRLYGNALRAPFPGRISGSLSVRSSSRSAFTISVTRSPKDILCFQPSFSLAFEGSPRRMSTSVGRK